VIDFWYPVDRSDSKTDFTDGSPDKIRKTSNNKHPGNEIEPYKAYKTYKRAMQYSCMSCMPYMVQLYFLYISLPLRQLVFQTDIIYLILNHHYIEVTTSRPLNV
jgi:hypothetical protein